MARKSSSQAGLPRIGITLLLIIVLGGAVIFLLAKRPQSEGKANNFPIEEYMTRGSSLRDNQYSLFGKVENREITGKGELITLVVKNAKGEESRLPVIVPSTTKGINLEREQSYTFDVIVGSVGDAKGLLIAEKIIQ